MSILTSKQQKSHVLIDPILILFFSALVLLTFFALFTGNVRDFVSDALGSIDKAPATLSINSQPSFAADQQYWEANCSRGWSSDSMCENIVLRSQSCSVSSESAYCSEYNRYLQEYR